MDHLSSSCQSASTTRYVPPPPPPRRPSPFSDDPNFRPSHHHHPPPPHQPLPPPPQPTYRPRPAPPSLQQPPHSYNLHHPSQFSFSNPNPNPNPSPNRSLEDDRPRSFHPLSPRVSHRLASQEDRPVRHLVPDHDRLYPENRPDFWESPRIVAARPYPVVDLDRDPRHRSFASRTSPPGRRIEVFRHEHEGGSRFREERIDQHSQREKQVWDQNDGYRRGSNSDRSSRSFGFNVEHSSSSSRGVAEHSSSRGIEHNYSSRGVEHSTSSRGFESNSGSYDKVYVPTRDSELGRGSRDENQIWVQGRQSMKGGRESSFEMGCNEVIDGDGGRMFVRKREYNASESGRYNNAGNRESSNEYVPQPRKQLQKKSALLRIQVAKPNHRNRDSEHSQYSGYFGDSNTNYIRGRDQLGYSGHGRENEEEGEPEGSPVELDVSFKSNSLVAKAIVTPPSSKVASDTKVTPRSRKIRKVLASDKDCSSSLLAKFNEGSSRLDSTNDSASSGKDVKQSGKKVTASGIVNINASSSQARCDGTDNLIATTKGEGSQKKMNTDKSGANTVTTKTSSPKIVKKKKIVKKIIKKVMAPRSRLSSSQPAKKCDGPVGADGSIAPLGSNQCLTTSKDDKLSVMASTISVDLLQPDLNKVTILTENDKVGDSPQVIVSEECGNDVNYVGRTRDVTTSLASSGHEIKIGDDLTSADASSPCLRPLKSPIDTTCSDYQSVEDIGKEICPSGGSSLLENGVEEESQKGMFSADGNAVSGLFSSENIRVDKDPMMTHCTGNEMNIDLVLDIGLVSSQEKSGYLDISPCQPCTNDVLAILQSDTVEAHPKSIVRVGSNDTVLTSGSVETEPVYADCSDPGRDTVSGSDNGWANCEEIATTNSGTAYNIRKQQSSNELTKSPESDAMKGSPDTKVSLGGCWVDTPKSKKKRKVWTSQLDSSTSEIMDKDVGSFNQVSPVHSIDTTLNLPLNDSNPDEVTVSGAESLGVDLQLNTSQVNVLNGSSESEISVVFPSYKNKRKFSVLHLGLSGNEGALIVDSKAGKEVLSELNNGLTQQEDNAAASGIVAPCSSSLQPSGMGITPLLEDELSGGAFEIVSSVIDAFAGDGSKLEQPNSDPPSPAKEMTIPNLQSDCPLVLGGKQKENDNLMTTTTNLENITDMESCRRDELNVLCAEEQVAICKETAQSRVSLELLSRGMDKGYSSADMESDSYPLVKDDLANVPNFQSLSAEEDGISTSYSNDELMDSVPSGLSDIGSPETTTDVTAIHPLNCKASFAENSSEKVSVSDKELAQRPLVEGSANMSTSTSFSKQTQIASNSELRASSGHSITLKTVPLQRHNSKNMTQSQNPLTAELYVRKNQVSNSIPRTFPAHSSFSHTNSKKTLPSTSITKPRTWHRSANSSLSSLPPIKSFSNIVPQQRQSLEKTENFQTTSYIRKGNSLVRKPTPVAAVPQGSDVSLSAWMNSSGIDDLKKGSGSDRIEVIDPSNVTRSVLVNSISERPRTSPLHYSTKSPNLSTSSTGNCALSPSAEPDLSGCSEPLSDPIKSVENGPKSLKDGLMRPGTPEDLSGPVNNVESQSENLKRVTYVKRKSNQLVASSSAFDLSVPHPDKSSALYSDGYYKRRKNQLIRTSLASQEKTDDSSVSEGQKASKGFPSRTSSKKQYLKVVAKTSKPSKLSLVWTLRGTHSSSKDQHEVLPVTPYKRATSWRSFLQNSASISNNSSSSITRKLLLSRKMNTIYTRSKHGFALRKSKVLSVGGSSLKWSKSIERRSKMVNEEATLAVAAAERKKREQNGANSCALTGTKNKNQSFRKLIHSIKLLPGERIFRIGSVRYKMDSSRRTLQRISEDDDESCAAAAASQSKNSLKKSYVPRRLLIGNDEYVRIGNGNQLVRDPKKRTRALASEKVRWSLHTARSRLARKRKYCLFYTRFGKCNKGDGKCPYIHDPSKIAVCTKFLNGFCSDSNCKLTHKVIPERMQDCSYFLQGLCTNEQCPYRHVNVNQNAPTCEGFLKGYCKDGDECRKKHSYTCPVFESTGCCPQGSKCKLHHPKKRGKGKKKKQSGEEKKHAQGRYFGSSCANSESGSMACERQTAQTNDAIIFEGNLTDYISLDFSDNEAGESNDATNEPSTFYDSGPSDVQLHELDGLIKPIRIMTR